MRCSIRNSFFCGRTGYTCPNPSTHSKPGIDGIIEGKETTISKHKLVVNVSFQGSGAGRQPLMSWRRCNSPSCQERRLDRLDFGNSIPKYPKCPLGMFDCQILFDSVKEMPQNLQYHERTLNPLWSRKFATDQFQTWDPSQQLCTWFLKFCSFSFVSET